MNLTHLRYIVEVARYGSVTKAAAALYIGQPNLSRIIKDTESELGVKLFRRTSKGVVPTAAGAGLIAHAERALAEIDSIAELSGQKVFRIMLPQGYPAASAASLIKPDISAEISEGCTAEAVGAVSSRVCDCAVIRFPSGRAKLVEAMLSEKGLRSRPIAEYDAVVIVSAADPLAKKPEISMNGLSDMTMIVRPDEKAAAASRRRITVGAGTDVHGLLASLDGACMISPPLPQTELDRFALAQIPLEGAEHYIELMIENAE